MAEDEQGESLWERGHRRDGLRGMTPMTSLDNTPTLIILDRLVAEVGALLGDLNAEAWTAPTPCAEFDAEAVAIADGVARAMDSDAMRSPGMFGPEVIPLATATPLEKLVAFLGRRP